MPIDKTTIPCLRQLDLRKTWRINKLPKAVRAGIVAMVKAASGIRSPG